MRFGLDDEPDVNKKETQKMEASEVTKTEEESGSSAAIQNVEASNKRKEFAMVVFHNIPETYPVDAHIECGYTVTSDFVPTTSDWIGLYKVGWLSTKNYIYYDWVNIPLNYEAGKDAEGHVLFPSHKLPNDDGEFYQFCYVTSKGQIRGASTPFQFRRPSAEDFVEIEDEETEMLVIRSKSIVMEEAIKKLESEKAALIQMQHDLEMERDELVNKLYQLDKHLQEIIQENKHLSDQVKVDSQTISQLQQEAKDLIMVRDEVQQRAESVSKDKQSVEDNLNQLETKISDLKNIITRLQSEKDELEGENLKLKQGIDMYKQHFTKLEGSDKEATQKIEDLQIKLTKEEILVQHLKNTLESVRAELEQTQLLLSRQGEVSAADKENIDWLSEKIQNLEDKLSAADNVKELLQTELKTYRKHNDKMSRDLENSKEDNHALQQRFNNSRETLEAEIADLQTQIVFLQEKVEEIKEENTGLRKQLEDVEENGAASSMQCLVMAQTTLKERYSKMEQSFSQCQTDVIKRNKEHRQQVKDLSREIEDLKERLAMGSNEYRNLYIENRKLVKKIEKLEKRKAYQHQSSDTVAIEQCQKSSESESSPVDDTMEIKVQDDLEEVGKELDVRQEKKMKYKLCLVEERKKVENLKKELKEKDDEIETLKKSLIEVQNEKEVKVRSLENYMSDKDKTIDELNRKIRDTINLHDGPCKIHSSEGSGAASSLEKPKTSPDGNGYPCMLYGGPYPGQSQQTALVYPQQTQVVYPVTNRPVLCQPQLPLVYPHPQMSFIPPPTYPRCSDTEEGQSAAASPPIPPPRTDLKKNVTSDDVIPEAEALDPPLQPLPPPMIPERLQTAKKAEIIYSFSGADGGQGLLSAPPMQDMKEERFVDAPGEGMKICPVCNCSFSADVTDSNFEDHVLGHVGRICPLCHQLVDNCTDEDFQRHVNIHLDQHLDAGDNVEFD